ncbi:hypothetical protein [Pseudomonas fontis]|uniref:DUF7832 domain-containing protein n=1 Tax=Pseudomonas fontis TaxID=2942633 RepID=A0ABT5NXZ4_9PSED|nr:hypothetical protein [Pseudomonas fontis]MDD0977455.1 hypothetical protein [Pseudomonas fontis]MDD0993075.1 hypothetical protein [Pseudomonas fontis]
MKYDDASWQYANDECPARSARSTMTSPSSFFLAWATFQGLLSRDFEADYDAEIEALAERLMTPGAFLLFCCDGQLVDEDFNARGNAFVASYLNPEHSPYLADVEACLANACTLADSWDNFDTLKPLLDQRFAQWLTPG